jgi:hypothetical protein
MACNNSAALQQAILQLAKPTAMVAMHGVQKLSGSTASNIAACQANSHGCNAYACIAPVPSGSMLQLPDHAIMYCMFKAH